MLPWSSGAAIPRSDCFAAASLPNPPLLARAEQPSDPCWLSAAAIPRRSMCDGVAGDALEATRLRRVLHCVPVPGATQASLGMPQASSPPRYRARRRGIGLRRNNERTNIMATIGSVTKRDDGRYEGELRTLSIRADIAILPVDRQGVGQPARLPRDVARHRDRCRLAAQRPDLRQGVRVALDRGTGVRRQDALRQPRPCRRADRSRRLRVDLESARLSGLPLFALAPATARGLLASYLPPTSPTRPPHAITAPPRVLHLVPPSSLLTAGHTVSVACIVLLRCFLS